MQVKGADRCLGVLKLGLSMEGRGQTVIFSVNDPAAALEHTVMPYTAMGSVQLCFSSG